MLMAMPEKTWSSSLARKAPFSYLGETGTYMQTDKEVDKYSDRHRSGQRDKEWTSIQTDKEIDKERNRQTCRQRNK